MAESARLESAYRRKAILGSNPSLTANWNFASETALPRGAERAARLEFERVFLAKRKRIYQ